MNYIFALIFSATLSETSHSKKNSARLSHKCTSVLVKSIRYYCEILMKFEFLDRFSRKKNLQISNFMKIRPVGAELFHVDRQSDRQTYMTKLIVSFRNSVKASKNCKKCLFPELENENC